MAKAWKDVQAGERYQSLAPEEKNTMQLDYFNSVVAPKVPAGEVGLARSDFMEAFPLQESRTLMSKEQQSGILQQGLGNFELNLPGLEVDVTTGVKDPMFRAAFSRMDTDEERENWLNINVGEGSYGKTGVGTYYLSPEAAKNVGQDTNGQRLLIDEAGISWQDFADWSGDLPAALGGIGAGMAATGYGFVPGLLLAGLGAAGGKGIDESIEFFQGLQRQSAGEVATDIAIEGALALTGEGVGRGISRGITKLKGLNTEVTKPSSFFGRRDRTFQSTHPDEHNELVLELLEEGAQPLISEAALGKSPLVAARQNFFLRLFDKTEFIGRNDKWVEQAKANLVRNASDGEDILEPSAAGESVFTFLQNRGKDLVNNSKLATQNLEKNLDEIAKKEQARLGGAPGPMGSDFIKAVDEQHGAFMDQAANMSSALDDFSGGVPTIPTSRLKNQMQQILDEFPKTTDGKPVLLSPNNPGADVVNNILNMEPYITARQMWNMQSALGAMKNNKDFLPGVKNRQYSSLLKAADGSYDDAVKFVDVATEVEVPTGILDASGKEITRKAKAKVSSPIPDEAGTAYKEALDNFRSFYKEGVNKFDDHYLNAVTRDPSLAGSIDPDIALKSVRSGDEGGLKKLKALMKPLSPEQQAEFLPKMARSHLDDSLAKGTTADGTINFERAYNEFTKTNDEVLAKMYGSAEEAARVGESLRRLGVASGRVPHKLLENVGVTDDLSQAVVDLATSAKLEGEFFEKGFVRAILKGGRNKEEAIDWLIAPGHGSRLKEARVYFGETSKEWKQIRASGMQKMLMDASEVGDSPLDIIFHGKKFLNTLENKYGMKALTELYGKEQADSLIRFAKKAQIASAKPGTEGAIATAQMYLRPLANLKPLAKIMIFGKIISTPAGVRNVTIGLSDPSPLARREAMTRLGVMISTELAGDLPGAAISAAEVIEAEAIKLGNKVNGGLELLNNTTEKVDPVTGETVPVEEGILEASPDVQDTPSEALTAPTAAAPETKAKAPVKKESPVAKAPEGSTVSAEENAQIDATAPDEPVKPASPKETAQLAALQEKASTFETFEQFEDQMHDLFMNNEDRGQAPTEAAFARIRPQIKAAWDAAQAVRVEEETVTDIEGLLRETGSEA